MSQAAELSQVSLQDIPEKYCREREGDNENRRLRKIDVDFLTLRRKDKGMGFPVPKFIPFSIKNPKWKAEVEDKFGGETGSMGRLPFCRQYRDVIGQLKRRLTFAEAMNSLARWAIIISLCCAAAGAIIGFFQNWFAWNLDAGLIGWGGFAWALVEFFFMNFLMKKGITFSSRSYMEAELDSGISDAFKEKLGEGWMDQEFDGVYLVTEAPSWKINAVTKIALATDPFVIGRRQDDYYLISVPASATAAAKA